MEQSTLLADAAAVAGTFGLDPYEVLADRNSFRRAVRVAAHNVLVREANKRKGG